MLCAMAHAFEVVCDRKRFGALRMSLKFTLGSVPCLQGSGGLNAFDGAAIVVVAATIACFGSAFCVHHVK